jgi:threonyl-tRNA synthetase
MDHKLSDELHRIRHSAAHVVAQAVRDYFAKEGPVQYGVGPATENGFFYDFVLPRPLSVTELPAIEDRVREIIRDNHAIERRDINAEEAYELFKDQPFKLKLLDSLTQGKTDEDGNPITDGRDVELSIYGHHDWFDLCRGPHVPSTGALDPEAIRLLNVSSVYWQGDANNPSLSRIYGTAFASKADFERYEWMRQEAERRDHRRLGKQLELFHFDPTAPGMPYWLPKGLTVLNELIDYWRVEHKKLGYYETATPMVNRKELWEKSGHWEHYRENMFIINIDENNVYGVKPMNCPNAMVIYNLKTRSHRDLPLRLSDCDALHRHETSGSLHGLLRVQLFRQDDAHIFITEDQIEEEYQRILEICDRFYSVFGLTYKLRMGTRPDDFIGDIESWNRAEDALRRILDRKAGPGNYTIEEGDGAFYGPKVDILMEDCLGREWQMGTLQLDFQLPRRFECTYTDKDGTLKTPVVVHRVIYGSLERFIGILIEHYAGAFPLWIAPIQARLIPIADRHLDYCSKVKEQLEARDIRCEIDDSDNRMNAKIRTAQIDKIPYMLVAGDKEVESGGVAVRLLSGENLGPVGIDDLLTRMRGEIDSKTLPQP